MQPKIAWLSLASTLLLACNNTAPIDDSADAAGASAALDRPGHACQLGQLPVESPPEQTRGLYEVSTTGDAARALPCGDETAGRFGIRVELDVFAPPTAEHDPSRGSASLLLHAQIDAQDDVTLQLCGLELPPRYAYATSAVTELQLPEEIFDRESMPVWKSKLHALPDGAVQLDAFPMLLGIALHEPDAAWPSFDQTTAIDCGRANENAACFPDHDGDGRPGLSFRALRGSESHDAPYPACTDWQQRGPSTDDHLWSANSDSEASQLFVGLRTALQLLPRFDETCSTATGLARAADIVTRTLDCELTDGQRCSPRQATVIDQRSPTFHVLEAGETPPETFRDSRDFVDEALDRNPSEGGRLTMQRLPETAANCAAVRTALAH